MGWNYDIPSGTICTIAFNYSNQNTFRRCVLWVHNNPSMIVQVQSNSFLVYSIGI